MTPVYLCQTPRNPKKNSKFILNYWCMTKWWIFYHLELPVAYITYLLYTYSWTKDVLHLIKFVAYIYTLAFFNNVRLILFLVISNTYKLRSRLSLTTIIVRVLPVVLLFVLRLLISLLWNMYLRVSCITTNVLAL